MKTYRIKKQFESELKGLNGLHITPTERQDYININVLDNHINYLCTRHELKALPENSNKQLVHDFLKQIQFNKITDEQQVQKLRVYLQCAENKDKNNEIKSDVKASLKQFFKGLLLIGVGGAGGFVLMVFLMGLLPAAASCIAFLIIPIMAAATYGIIKTVLGCLKLAIGIFSFCFRQKNVEQLSTLEKELCDSIPFRAPPPPYCEVKENYTTYPIAPALDSELPTYQQAIEIAALSAKTATQPSAIPASVLPPSPHFFHHHLHHSVSNPSAVNATPPPIYFFGHYR